MDFSKSFKALEETLERIFSGYKESYFHDDFSIIERRGGADMSLIKRRIPHLQLTVEVGVQKGLFSKRIHDSLRPRVHYCIDSWKHFDVGYEEDSANVSDEEHERRYAATRELFKEEIKNGTVKLIRDSSVNALRRIPEGSIDFIYIDANHNYSFARDDLFHATGIVKSGGIIGGHDFTRPGIKQAVAEICEQTRFKLIAYGLCCSSYYLMQPFDEEAQGPRLRPD